MPSLAKAYIAVITAAALAVMAVVASEWNPANLGIFALFFTVAMIASAMKIRLPGFKTTISMNFVFILTGIALFSLGETVLIGLGGALVQSLWKAQHRPKPVQVLFNAACLTVCAATAFWTSHTVPVMLGLNSVMVTLVLGAGVYLALNTGLVSLVISLAEGRPLIQEWPSCYEWTFPYFLVGAALAGIASTAARGTNVGASLVVLPMMYLVYVYYRMRIMRVVLEGISSASASSETALVGASRTHA